jgi:hypothetical protein
LNLAIPADLLDEFNEACKVYGHAKQKGMVLSAAILMFLRSDPAVQGRCLEDVGKAEITGGVQAMIERAKAEQGLAIAAREATDVAGRIEREAADASEPVKRSSEAPRRQKKAAKKQGKSRKGISKLPDLDDLT